MNIAITHNYLSPNNLGNALKFFVEKQDQISGCRDRAESVKPERMYSALVDVLKNKEPQHLEKALAQTEWTCRAWSNPSMKDSKDGADAILDPKNPPTCWKNRRKESSRLRVEKETAERKSIMEQTERVPSFSFSFL